MSPVLVPKCIGFKVGGYSMPSMITSNGSPTLP